ncbi:MAG: NRDE family protein [Bradymonadaceae bacterium]
MCTLLITERLGGGYLAWANRDESHTRPRAEPPSIDSSSGIRVIQPIDPLGGGTWIAVNEAGVTTALLNQYQAHCTPNPPLISRGQVVKSLALCEDLDAFQEKFKADVRPRLENIAGFILLAISAEPGHKPRIHRISWDGEILSSKKMVPPWLEISSGVEPLEVRRRRRENLRTFLDTPLLDWSSALPAFRGHEPSAGPSSICMHRDDASTVSHTGVAVTDGTVTMYYIDGSPCGSQPPRETRLARTAQPGKESL